MVSTYASLELINRDMRKSIDRIQSQAEIERETAYFKENISKVTTVDEFMDDYRLYSYAMKAYGLEDMTYAKAFMKKVLDSDLTDSDSFAMKLSDDKYRNFAAAFKFSSETLAAQTSSQEDDAIEGYEEWRQAEADNADTEAAYFKEMIGSITSVDELLADDRLYQFALKSLDLDPTYSSRTFIKQVLTSDTSDSSSFVNQLTTYKETYVKLADSFNFNSSGTLDSGVAVQDDDQTQTMTDNYIINVPSYTTQSAALINMDYMREQIASVTSVDDITGNSRLFSLVKVAFGFDENMLKSQFFNIVTSDTSVSDNYAESFGGDAWVKVADLFNFDTDGNVADGGTAMSDSNLDTMVNYYSSTYNDEDDADLEELEDYYHTYMDYVDSIDELFTFPKLYDLALKAVGIDPDETSEREVRRVLTSDLNDPLSYANRQNDDRFAALAKSFNFDSDGNKRAPFIAQPESSILNISRDYVFQKTRFDDSEKTSDDADAEAEYYATAMESVESLDDFLGDERLVNFVLESQGIDPEDISADDLEQLFTSDLEDPESFVNTYSDTRFINIVASFNFNEEGNLAIVDTSDVQSRGSIYKTVNNYYAQALEEQAGEDNTGVRLALYFERQAHTINSAYDILGDAALLEVFKTAFSLPDGFSNLDIDVQADMVEKYIDLSDFGDEEKLSSFIQRFTALYDLENSSTSSINLLSSGGSISADTLYTLSQLKLG